MRIYNDVNDICNRLYWRFNQVELKRWGAMRSADVIDIKQKLQGVLEESLWSCIETKRPKDFKLRVSQTARSMLQKIWPTQNMPVKYKYVGYNTSMEQFIDVIGYIPLATFVVSLTSLVLNVCVNTPFANDHLLLGMTAFSMCAMGVIREFEEWYRGGLDNAYFVRGAANIAEKFFGTLRPEYLKDVCRNSKDVVEKMINSRSRSSDSTANNNNTSLEMDVVDWMFYNQLYQNAYDNSMSENSR